MSGESSTVGHFRRLHANIRQSAVLQIVCAQRRTGIHRLSAIQRGPGCKGCDGTGRDSGMVEQRDKKQHLPVCGSAAGFRIIGQKQRGIQRRLGVIKDVYPCIVLPLTRMGAANWIYPAGTGARGRLCLLRALRAAHCAPL